MCSETLQMRNDPLEAYVGTGQKKRREVIGNVIKSLGEDLKCGRRNELLHVSPAYGSPECFLLERAAATCLGMKPHRITPTDKHTKRVGGGSCNSKILSEVKPAGAISYSDIDGFRYRREVHFCYVLKLPEG